MSNRGIAAAVHAKLLKKVHTGWFVDSESWGSQYAEGRHLIQVVAAHEQMRGGDCAYVLDSAAVLWELPLFRRTPTRVHLGGAHVDGRTRADTEGQGTRAGVARHEVKIAEEDLTYVDGIPCTTLERTVYDMMRSASREAGLSIADAALRRAAWDPAEHRYDEDAADRWRASLRERVARNSGARGIRRARTMVEFADGRAELPGESVSRLYLRDLGFAPPRLQVAIPGPNGRDYFVDFGLDDVDAWGEFDGVGKYVGPSMTHGREALKVLAAEKERQDWIHGTTHRISARWGTPDIASAATLGARLASFHLRPPR